MINISISSELKDVCSKLSLGCIQCQVMTEKFNKQLWEEVEKISSGISKKVTMEQIYQLLKIKDARDAYRELGKDPTRYRLSSEALIRRILQGKSLYQINNIVDINNLVSLKSFYSVGSYNLKKIIPPLTFRTGKKKESYKGIGKEIINIENLPILVDSIGPLGSPTSDSERSMITMETTCLLMMIFSFSGDVDIAETLDYAKWLLEKYAAAAQIEYRIVT